MRMEISLAIFPMLLNMQTKLTNMMKKEIGQISLAVLRTMMILKIQVTQNIQKLFLNLKIISSLEKAFRQKK